MFGPTFDFEKSQSFQFKKLNHWNVCNPPDFHLPTWEKFAPPYTLSRPSVESLKWSVTGASTLVLTYCEPPMISLSKGGLFLSLVCFVIIHETHPYGTGSRGRGLRGGFLILWSRCTGLVNGRWYIVSKRFYESHTHPRRHTRRTFEFLEDFRRTHKDFHVREI